MIDLERALVDLAEHLDHPAGANLSDDVRRRIAGPVVGRDRSRQRSTRASLLALAAVVLLIVGAVVTISPARSAIADWLGIGAVEVRRSVRTLPTGPPGLTVPGARGSSPEGAALKQLAAAQKQVDFTIVTSHDPSAGALSGVQVDRRVRGGLVVLGYARFTLVEIATSTNDGPILGKLLDPAARAEPVTVDGRSGMWITGAPDRVSRPVRRLQDRHRAPLGSGLVVGRRRGDLPDRRTRPARRRAGRRPLDSLTPICRNREPRASPRSR